MSQSPTVERVLVIAAHPDDPEFAVGGTVASFTAAGLDVRYCVVTDGAAGGIDHLATRPERAARRRQEQVAAAAVLGVTDVRFLDYLDGELLATVALRRDLAQVIRDVRPDRVLVHSPERNWRRVCDMHPDHLAVGEAALAAIYPDARNPFSHPALLDAGLEPWTVPETWLFGTPMPDYWVEVTAYLDRQLEALREHHSQTDHVAHLAATVTRVRVGNAAAGGLSEGRLAEAFMVVDTA